MSIEDDLVIDKDDPRFDGINRAADVLFAEAMKVGLSEPGEERGQACHFAISAILNASALDHDDVARVLGAIVGTTVIYHDDPDTSRTL